MHHLVLSHVTNTNFAMTREKFETIKWPSKSKSFTCRMRNSCDTWLNSRRFEMYDFFASGRHLNIFPIDQPAIWYLFVGYLHPFDPKWHFRMNYHCEDIFDNVTPPFVLYIAAVHRILVLGVWPYFIISFLFGDRFRVVFRVQCPKTAHKLAKSEEKNPYKTMNIKPNRIGTIYVKNRKWQTIHKFSFVSFRHIDHVNINKTLLGRYFFRAKIYSRFLVCNANLRYIPIKTA